jgi:hypothetical protein
MAAASTVTMTGASRRAPTWVAVAGWRAHQVDARIARNSATFSSSQSGPGSSQELGHIDGYVAWVGDGTDTGLRDALTTWFGPR